MVGKTTTTTCYLKYLWWGKQPLTTWYFKYICCDKQPQALVISGIYAVKNNHKHLLPPVFMLWKTTTSTCYLRYLCCEKTTTTTCYLKYLWWGKKPTTTWYLRYLCREKQPLPILCFEKQPLPLVTSSIYVVKSNHKHLLVQVNMLCENNHKHL